ncbi:MAG: ABC transporter ATP-binding protein [Armatimonadota bacterium]|nr:ABC transporter ATP-binding protein [Armatimonadota bacterium]MDR7426349.1 ABC transporter ATP-binding protein [Armatimonadota bacterium]MDR7463353.1 ABC transporter ATP-binding protein [Armatimonadota bacterium]MDR7469167.1 ABC transporter ATP-binding protein [Armatimonadota bacterium]MDR7474562.1 ABC transporter ATP-binding protein [Armatimonadota bacterium]
MRSMQRPQHPATTSASAASLLEVRDLHKDFFLRGGLVGASWRRITALSGVSFSVPPGRIVGVVGESGSGKSTLGELVVGLQEPTGGEVCFDGRPLSAWLRRSPREFRRRAQIIFQNPYESLNPRFTVMDAVEEPLVIQGVPRRARRDAVVQALTDCGLRPAEDFLLRYPHELSGGQRQRVAIARAVVVDPDFLVADEPVSMLDVSVRSGILNLLADLRKRRGLAILFISHDLATVRYLCDEIIVLYLGHIMEQGAAEELVRRPRHPYTQALLAAAPLADPDQPLGEVPVRGEPETGTHERGCVFAPRCPHAVERCRAERPPLRPVVPGVLAACHFATPQGRTQVSV